MTAMAQLSHVTSALQVEIEKELRRQLLDIDEHSSQQARQLELLHQHTLAMHTLAPGATALTCPYHGHAVYRTTLTSTIVRVHT